MSKEERIRRICRRANRIVWGMGEALGADPKAMYNLCLILKIAL